MKKLIMLSVEIFFQMISSLFFPNDLEIIRNIFIFRIIFILEIGNILLDIIVRNNFHIIVDISKIQLYVFERNGIFSFFFFL